MLEQLIFVFAVLPYAILLFSRSPCTFKRHYRRILYDVQPTQQPLSSQLNGLRLKTPASPETMWTVTKMSEYLPHLEQDKETLIKKKQTGLRSLTKNKTKNTFNTTASSLKASIWCFISCSRGRTTSLRGKPGRWGVQEKSISG